MSVAVSVAVGGAAGALARWAISLWFSTHVRGPFPWGTFVINIAGCLLLGAITGLALRHTHLPSTLQIGISTGFIGAFTTFSTFNLETVRLLEEQPLVALAYVVGSLSLGLLTIRAGMWVADVLHPMPLVQSMLDLVRSKG